MANAIQQAGGASEPSSFAPLHTNRMFTGLWTNRSPLSDAAISSDMEKYGLGRQDSIISGLNSELSSRLTLRRRYGTSVYNTQSFPPINRYYSFNTFTLTTELIRLMVDTGMGGGVVYDATSNAATPNTKTPIWTKSAGAGPTFFLGLGNTLYFTNGVDNKQWVYNPATGSGPVYNWGIIGPPTAPNVSQIPRPNPYPAWSGSTGHAAWIPMNDGVHFFNYLVLIDPNNNIQAWGYQLNNAPPLLQVKTGTLGTSASLPWSTTLNGTTLDGTVAWTNLGNKARQPGFGYAAGQIISVAITNPAGTPDQLFVSISNGNAGGGTITNWPIGIGQQISDGTNGLIWQNAGPALNWSNIGSTTAAVNVTTQPHIVDPNGYLQTVNQQGKTAASPPATWVQETGALTTDGGMVWVNSGPYAVPGTASVRYGYAYKNAAGDISNMSPASTPITVIQGNEVTVSGVGSSDPQVTTIYIYRTAQGGSTFLYLDQIANPAGGGAWTYTDNTPDSGLNVTIQAQVNGEGTPLPTGATCMAYHLQRFFVAVGNVTYVSSGPDAIASTSSGNAGFNTTFTCQSKIIRYWVSPLGLIIFTVRDSYIILGTGTSADPLYQTTFIDSLPLLHYDAFTTHLTTPYLLLGTNMLVALDPSAGITEIGFPIADRLEEEFNAATAYVTYHTQASKENALYVDDGVGSWYRMSATTAPETGLNWSPKATLNTPSSAVQSCEVTPGVNRLLIGPGAGTNGPIRMRDLTVNTDLGVPFTAHTTFGSIVLAHPGELAQLAFFTLESKKVGSRPALSVLLGEVYSTDSAPFESLGRTRQDPPLLPPSDTLYSDRYHFLQSQAPAWCRHFQMDVAWPAEDAANELLTFTIFGQTWQEYRSQ